MKKLGSPAFSRDVGTSDWRTWQGIDFDPSGKVAEQTMFLGAILSFMAVVTCFFAPDWFSVYMPNYIGGVPSPLNIIFLVACLLFFLFAKAAYARRRRAALPILSISYEAVTGYQRLGSKHRRAIRWPELRTVKFSHGAVIFYGYKDSLMPGRETITTTLQELGIDQKRLEEILRHFSRDQWPKA